ncbi:RASL1 protein, partial [Ciconia maguari]|nr:RASL1 protein [Ciconia maguari]
SGSSDPYCVVKVDNEVVARTATVWKSLNPFWGEEYTLRLPRGFRRLAVYVLDAGHIPTPRGAHPSPSAGVDSWLSLAPVDPNEEVQGEIHLELRVLEQGHPRVLRCHLIEARLPLRSSVCVHVCARVCARAHTRSCQTASCWQRSRRQRQHPAAMATKAGTTATGWPWGQPGGTAEPPRCAAWPPGTEGEEGVRGRSAGERGPTLASIPPAPAGCPTDARCAQASRGKGGAQGCRDEVTSGESRQDVATKLVKIFLGQGLAVPLLDYLTARELARTTDPNTLFRSNSLASKSVEQFMKVVGLPYLHEVLKPVVNRIFEEKKYVELDPGKMELSRSRRVRRGRLGGTGRISFKGSLSEARVRESSLELLKGYLGDIVDAIVGSVEKCPLVMRMAFKQLRRRVEERFPSAQHE